MANFENLSLAYWGGEWHCGRGGTFTVQDPSIRTNICDVTDCTQNDVEEAIASAEKAFVTFSQTTVVERANLLMKIRDGILKHKDDFASLCTKENGKPLPESKGEVGFAASFFEWFAGETRRQYGEVIPGGVKSKRMITIRQPIGVAALITPWNFPIGMLGRKVSAAIAAGCTCVLKPAEDTPLSAIYFAKICEEVGVPPGVVNIVPCSRNRAKEVGEILCSSPAVKVLSFTGSSAVGKLLYSQCAPTMKRVAMELGGNAPFIVFPSADLDLAAKGLMAGKFRNTGQTCVTANRVFVHEDVHDEFVAKFCTLVKSELKLGSGFTVGANQGPIINQRQLDRLSKLVNNSVEKGAKMVMGGKPPQGLFFEPTVLTNVTPDMPVANEEIFGPVAAILKFKTEEEVVAQANSVEVGLAGYFYTSDISQSWRVAEALQYGLVGMNESLVSTAEAPFGGFKASGIGKEGSKYGLDEFTNVKYVCFGNI